MRRRKRSAIRELERDSYLVTRTLGDARAIETGGAAGYAKRRMRRYERRTLLGFLHRFGL